MTEQQKDIRASFEKLAKFGKEMGMTVAHGKEYLRVLPTGIFDPETHEIPNQFWRDQTDDAMKVVAEGEPCSIVLPEFMKA
jgi:hypothetical protein